MILKDKTVVLTGGSEGVGAATARLFAEAGANLVLVARSRKKLEAIAEELRDKTRVETFPMDVGDADACADVFKKAQFEFGRVDILVNNAGFHARGEFETVAVDELARMVDVNLKGPVMLMRHALAHIRESGGGAIINVGSLAGRLPVPAAATYAATKAALRSLTYSLGVELRGSGIKLAIVSPGPIDTGFIMDDIDAVSDLTFSQPLSTADEVAQAILDLCGNSQRELSMPRASGWLTMLAYLFPWLSDWLRPTLQKKGARVKAQLKAERRRRASDSPASQTKP